MSRSRIKAIVIGGSAAGLAAGIPYLSFLNVLCCGLVVGGAMLAVYLAFRSETPAESPYGSGAAIGALAGVVAAAVATAFSIPTTLVFGNVAAELLQRLLQEDGPVQIEGPIRGAITWAASSGGSLTVLALIFGLTRRLAAYGIFGTLGGVLGAAFFREE